MTRRLGCVSLALLSALVAGCLEPARIDLTSRTGGNAALVGQFEAYDGHSGRRLSFAEVAARCRHADAILFGEEHNDVVCNELEAQLLYALERQPRPVVLAMEFFEDDTQAALDAYLRGRIAEEPFREETHQGRAYILSHRPLIELCRLMNVPVIAANAPRRLVHAYRVSGLDYDAFRAGLEPAEQRWLPTENTFITGGYRQRFMEIMQDHGGVAGPATQPAAMPTTMPTTAAAAGPPGGPPGMPHMDPAAMYQAQLLWDQTMAESLATCRARYPTHRVMLIVGGFHVMHDGGTAIKFRQLRPLDEVLTIAYRGVTSAREPFEEEDRGAGDIVIYGIKPPEEAEREAPAGAPTAMPPTTQPTTAEAPATQPAEAPASQPATAVAALPPLREIPIHDVLVIGGIGHWGRTAAHTDAIEAEIIAGHWSPPSAGQTVALPDGSTKTWKAVAADEKGVIRDAALEGGYVLATVESERDDVLLLEAAGHSMVYANGEPRAGDPYQWGFVRVPVAMKAGANQFLFACGRGELRAKLVEPRSSVMIDTSDSTLPDLIAGQAVDTQGAVVVINATDQPLRDAAMRVRYRDSDQVSSLPLIPAMSVRKVAFGIVGGAPLAAKDVDVALALVHADHELASGAVQLRVRQPTETYKRTLVSDIDGSVQYYAVTPMKPAPDAAAKPALFLSLHGAGVEALGQAVCYANKSWGHVVAPTNRRPYGFDWEDWGRLDALEVLADAEKLLDTDPQRTYLTGHSMGGHGTWQIGAQYPDRFAAIAPSAGWIDWSYAGTVPLEPDTPIAAILRRATNPSDTMALSSNYVHYGVYVLHGEKDDNVPVKEARRMRARLGEFHPNFAYYERPGAGHWWGSECMDWPPLFEFLQRNTRPATSAVRHIQFVTANPAITATCDWATIEAQLRCLDLSRIDLQADPNEPLIKGTTDNVARLALSNPSRDHNQSPSGSEGHVPSRDRDPSRDREGAVRPVTLDLDGDRLENVAWPADGAPLRLERQDGHWQIVSTPPDLHLKGPHRGGPFKEAFRHRVQLVYGTRGTPEENAWQQAKARYDAEVFWVRGNGSVDVVADRDFDPGAEPDRGVMLYGNADTNSAWRALLGDAPVQVARGAVQVGERRIEGDDLAVLACYPRPRSEQAMVGVVAGTGLSGLRLTERLPYFVSGVAYPDWVVIGPEMLQSGVDGVRAAGFFDSGWQIDSAQSAWR